MPNSLTPGLAQLLGGFPTHIADFIGSRIVSRGGYSESLQGIIGWGVHISVSVAYAALAVGSTLITAPAIGITTSLLSGQGFPDALPGLNHMGGSSSGTTWPSSSSAGR